MKRCQIALLIVAAAGPAAAQPPVPSPPDVVLEKPRPEPAQELAQPAGLSLPEAVTWALQRNPQLATLRRAHGIAAAAVVIADTYPFNPLIYNRVTGDGGPASAGITNRVFNEHYASIALELHGQGRHRRAAAEAGLSRADWDIAAQETALAVSVLRAFDAVLYRRGQVRLATESLRFQEDALQRVGRLVEQGGAGPADLVLARADLADMRAAQGPARTMLDQASNQLRRLLGLVDEPLAVQGTLDEQAPSLDPVTLGQRAANTRPDLQALRLAVREAEARVRLEIANRWGAPSVGTFFEYNETSVYFIGGFVSWPLPICDTRQGEIQQRQAELDRAQAAVRQGEVQARQDVQAALMRVADAAALVRTCQTTTLPSLEQARDSLDRLFAQGRQGVDLSRVLDIRRRLLRARGVYLDALWELSQARADLGAAVGDPFLILAAPPPAAKLASPADHR
jgi:outer membrane protein TolC